MPSLFVSWSHSLDVREAAEWSWQTGINLTSPNSNPFLGQLCVLISSVLMLALNSTGIILYMCPANQKWRYKFVQCLHCILFQYRSDTDSDSDNDLFTINTIRYILCNLEYFAVCGEGFPKHFLELHYCKVNKIVQIFITHSFDISSA